MESRACVDKGVFAVSHSHLAQVHCPEVLAEVRVPSDILYGKLIDIVAAKSDVAELVIPSKVEGKHFLVDHALLISNVDEEVGTVVTNLHRRESHQTV